MRRKKKAGVLLAIIICISVCIVIGSVLWGNHLYQITDGDKNVAGTKAENSTVRETVPPIRDVSNPNQSIKMEDAEVQLDVNQTDQDSTPKVIGSTVEYERRGEIQDARA